MNPIVPLGNDPNDSTDFDEMESRPGGGGAAVIVWCVLICALVALIVFAALMAQASAGERQERGRHEPERAPFRLHSVAGPGTL